jgi:hypothetical protein
MKCIPASGNNSVHPVLLFAGGVIVGLGSAIYLSQSRKVRVVWMKPVQPVIDPDAVPFETQGVHDAAGY